MSVLWRAEQRVRAVTRFAWRRLDRACLSAGIAVFIVASATSLLLGPPPPYVHDEFSYLLAADTFVHGRLTNPPHPMWEHLETFHVLQQPTYASKYPPAQGASLALGQILSGFPILGVWIVLALAGAALCWMLGGWFPPGWSFLGASIVVLQAQVARLWGDSYWGGGVALLGGALVLGSVPRLCRRTLARDALAMGCGLVILALSRPYEGAIGAVVPVATVLFVRLRPSASRSRAALVLLPAAGAVLLAGALFIGYYDFRVTGSPWRMPYAAYEQTYTYVPVFGWQPMRTPPPYRHEVFARLQRDYAAATFYATSLSPDRWSFKRMLMIETIFRPFVAWALLLPVVACLRRPRGAAVLGFGMLAAVLGAVWAEAWSFPHYFAPGIAPLCVLVTLGLRQLMTLRAGSWRIGPAAVALALGLVVVQAIPAYRMASVFARYTRTELWANVRVHVAADLARLPAKQLVVVRYSPQHNFHEEWVYNGADVDGAHVVWAREMDPASNRKLLDYFRDRQPLLLLPDESPIRLVPYPR